MHHLARLGSWLALALAACACAGESDETQTAPPSCVPPNRIVGSACLEPGVQDNGCPAGTLGLDDGSCRPAGIAEGECGDGFAHDGDVGCAPILPAEPCAPGQMAVPGDTACRAVMPCAPGTWGGIVVDANTEHVDTAYPGLDSDGSAGKPWTTIATAAAAAVPGATIAIAAGTYSEDVRVQGKPVVLWGVCPDQVELAGTGAQPSALLILEGADGTVVRGLAITGEAIGLGVIDAAELSIEQVWVHDSQGTGVAVEEDTGVPSCSLKGSLIEKSRKIGVHLSSADAVVEATVVRDTLPTAQGAAGWGINIQPSAVTGAIGTVVVKRSVVDRNHDVGVFVWGSEATIDDTVVRGTLPEVGQNLFGWGINVLPHPLTGAATRATVRRSLVERNHEIGIAVFGSEATVEATVVRDIAPNAAGLGGVGLQVQPGQESGLASTVALKNSLLERNRHAAAYVAGSTAVFESTVFRNTGPLKGFGVAANTDSRWGKPAALSMHGSLVQQNVGFGVVVFDSTATLEGCRVAAVAPQPDGPFGDGVTAALTTNLSTTQVSAIGSYIADCARAGASNFGASLSLEATAIGCSAFPLSGDPYQGRASEFEDRGHNACGCPVPNGTCKVAAASLEPPVFEPFEP